MKWNIEDVVINKKLFPCGASTEVEKTVTSSGADNIATFTTNERKPLTSLAIDIEPSQEGTGNPSPDNVRPLVSYDKVTAKIQKGTTKVKEVVSFGTTIYGLTGDCVTGDFESGWGVVTFNGSDSEGWAVYSSENGFYSGQIADMLDEGNMKGLATWLKVGGAKSEMGIRLGVNGNRRIYFYHITDNITGVFDVTTWKAYLNEHPITILYPLATPTEITIDPVTITTFSGEQTVRFDEKIPFTIKYLTLEGNSCDIAKQFLPLFYNKERRST